MPTAVKYGPAPVRCHGCGRVLTPEQWWTTIQDGKAWCPKCYKDLEDDCDVPCLECPNYPCWAVTT